MHIGLFDSGVGGLTVLKELKNRLPKAQFTYLGDTARLPYGNKAPETLLKYTLENIDFLDSRDVDVIIVACHSASSVSLNIHQSKKGTPVYNVIQPSCLDALKHSDNALIGIIATQATIKSGVYTKEIESLNKQAKVFSAACPLLVPLVEEGYIDDPITDQILYRYLGPLIDKGIETLILGCTHYPILEVAIAKVCGHQIRLIDPAQSVADKVEQMNKQNPTEGQLEIYLTDHSPHFLVHAQSLLKSPTALKVRYPAQ